MKRDVASVGRKTKAAALVAMLLLSPPHAFAADVELGRYLATECMTCHGASKSDSHDPGYFRQAGEPVDERLKAYRDKRLPNAVMQTVASRLKDDEIAALAAYFRTAKKPK